jgi:ribosomal protein S18 acetylase RimI-like enzyme
VPAGADLEWPTEVTEALAGQCHTLIGVVVGLGGAVGWLSPPARAVTDAWLAGMIADVTAGDGALCTAWRDGQLVAMGGWRRDEADYLHHLAELIKIMVHPAARGLRLGRTVSEALLGHASRAGIETMHLGVRGNNHLAIELYTELGFTEWGRLPNVIEVGAERYDDIRMYRRLNQPAHLVFRGSSGQGPGYSPPRRRPA